MKRCPNCGTVYTDAEQFCEACGLQLERVKEKKSPIPIIAGCVAAAVILVAGTVVAVRVIDGKKERQIQETTVRAEKNQAAAASENSGKKSRLTEAPEAKEKEDTKEENEEAAETESVTPVPTQDPVETPLPVINYPTYYVVNCQQSITLRKSPSTSAGEYCQIPLGAAVSYIGTADNGFYQVIYNGQTGYALAAYLSTDPNASSTAPSAPAQASSAVYMWVVNCQESITLRKVPSTKADQFCQIPLGARVEYLSSAENGFYMVSYNGYTGYALASYLTSDANAVSSAASQPAGTRYMRVVNCRESITLRKVPSTKADQFCQIPLGATVEFISTAENGFYMVSYNGYTGYALASYLAWS